MAAGVAPPPAVTTPHESALGGGDGMAYSPSRIYVKGNFSQAANNRCGCASVSPCGLRALKASEGTSDNFMIEFLKLGGGIAGIIALSWRIFEVLKSYLQIELEIQKDEDANRVHVITAVENKGYLAKTFDAAFLIVGPESETPDKTVRALRTLCSALDDFKTLNQMVTKVTQLVCHDKSVAMQGLHDDNGRAVIPLTYYSALRRTSRL